MLDSYFQPADGKRVFGADIHQSFAGTDGVTADTHGFYDRVRVAFHDGAVHKCAGVAFVRVANYIFDVRLLLMGKLPFQSCGEAATATSAQAGAFDEVDYVRRLLIEKAVRQCVISFAGDIFLDIFRVDKAAVAQGDA